MNKIFVLSLLFFSFFIFGCVDTAPQPNNSQPGLIDDDAMAGDGENSSGTAMDEGNMNDGAMDKDPMGNSMNDSSAGSSMSDSSSYIPFTKSSYDKAKAEGKVIYLEFYANWCPYCQEQKPIIESTFNSGQVPSNVAGFQVNYKDSDTDDSETALAREFGISYQHTRVILSSSGEVLHKSTGSVNQETLLALLKGAGA